MRPATWSRLFLVLLASSVVQGRFLLAADPNSRPIEFNRDIRPILSDNCYACHGPDKNQRKGKLRLDVREAALDKRAIVPGKPDESELVKRLYTTNPDGIGVGLAISRSIIEAHGGSLWASPPTRSGARVGFTLPLATAGIA